MSEAEKAAEAVGRVVWARATVQGKRRAGRKTRAPLMKYPVYVRALVSVGRATGWFPD
jgi:hypothetical protein